MTGAKMTAQARMPGLDATTVETVVGQMADLVLFLSPLQDITAMRVWGSMAEVACPDWVGRSFAEVLSRDSRSKLESIFARDAAAEPEKARWRHINLVCSVNVSLPVLVKFFQLGEGPDRVRVIVARDLRPTMDMQARLQRAYTEMEAAFETRGTPAGTSSGALVVAGMIDSIGQRPLGKIVAETAHALETLCVTEALRRCDGDNERAATLLQIAPDEVRRRSRVQ